jgi:hypothetical protein
VERRGAGARNSLGQAGQVYEARPDGKLHYNAAETEKLLKSVKKPS